MAERKRRRTILGYSENPCPHCVGGALVLTASRYVKRLRDVPKPRFDATVTYREVCQACRMRFPINTDAGQLAARSTVLATAPSPLFAGTERDPAEDDERVRPATPIRSTRPTQAAFFTDDDELDD